MSQLDDKLKMPNVPTSFEDALKVAKSLVSWIQYIKDNEFLLEDPYGSFGGHVDFHLAILNLWHLEMKIKSNAKNLSKIVTNP